MSEFVCKCGFSAKSKAGLAAHKRRCKDSGGPILDHDKFINRFTAGTVNRCPRCSVSGRSFYQKDSETWVCLDCGTHFTPECVLDKWRKELAEIQWKRP